MATVVLARNLGKPLVKQLGLDEKKTYLEGQTVEVSEDAHKELLKQGLVKSDEEVEAEEAARVKHEETMRGVAPQPGITAPARPATFKENPHEPAPKKDR